MSISKVPSRLEHDLRALCALSNVGESIDVTRLTSFVQEAPDPETAVRQVLDRMPASSDVLTRKWRNVITDIWALQHPHVPLLPELRLSAEDVHDAPLLNDAKALLAGLEEKSARLVHERQEWLVAPDDVQRLVRQFPSQLGTEFYGVENEWHCMPFRRLRAILHATRLVRPVKGELVPVRSRIARWRSLPPTQQFYILWHADVYHVDWPEFAGLWGNYMRVMQEYLPLLWEATNNVEADRIDDRAQWAVKVMETFAPLWDDEGLLDIRSGHTAALSIVQQHALPTIIDRFLLRDLLERHGLVTIREEFGLLSKFTWTNIGAAVIPTESGQDLPCGNDFLDS